MKNPRHLELYLKSKEIKPSYMGNIKYRYFWDGQDYVIYIDGSDEPKDWAFNFAFFGIFFHLGYFILARKFKKKVTAFNNIILVGHSLGAGIASILAVIAKKHIKEVILFGSPCSYTKINPLYPKNITSYLIKTDVVGYSWVIAPFFRRPVKSILLEHSFDDHIKNHQREGYEKALKTYFQA